MSISLWFFLLMLQNAAFTWVSRARNSGSLGYHAVASVFSNGIFFISQFFMISVIANQDLSLEKKIVLGLVYVTATVLGSVLMHWFTMKFLETGKRKVGS